jgi:hypothetical protein
MENILSMLWIHLIFSIIFSLCHEQYIIAFLFSVVLSFGMIAIIIQEAFENIVHTLHKLNRYQRLATLYEIHFQD